MTTTLRVTYPRTKCDCDKCKEPCQYMPGNLVPGDLERIAEHMGTSEEYILERYLVASPGAIVGQQTSKGMVVYRVPTIVPATVRGHCIFWDEDTGLCKIHEVAPFGCSHFDMHQSNTEANQRLAAMLKSIMEDEEYGGIWMFLWDYLKRITLPPEVKREAHKRGLDKSTMERYSVMESSIAG